MKLLLSHIKTKIEEVKDNALKDIANAEKDMQHVTDRILEQARTLDALTPVNLFKILVNGGFIVSKEIQVLDDDTRCMFDIDGKDILYDRLRRRIDKGNYQITVIIEKVEQPA